MLTYYWSQWTEKEPTEKKHRYKILQSLNEAKPHNIVDRTGLALASYCVSLCQNESQTLSILWEKKNT